MVLQLLDGINTLYVNHRDSITITGAEFLWVFINDHTYKKYACSPTETIVDDYRSSFEVTLTTNPIPLNGEVDMTLLGFYSVYIYEKTASEIATFDYSNIDTADIRNIDGIVWQGKAQLTESATTEDVYKDLRSSEDVYGN